MGIERVRFTSPYPVDFTADDDRRALAEEPKLCKYVHLPVQSGSDAVLGAHAPRLHRRRLPPTSSRDLRRGAMPDDREDRPTS